MKTLTRSLRLVAALLALAALWMATTRVYFGGNFDSAGGNSATGFARWGGAVSGNPPPDFPNR